MAAPLLGIAPLDERVPTPPRGSVVMVRSDPGVQAEPVMLQALQAQEGPVVFVSTLRDPALVAERAREYGLDVGNDVTWVDGYWPMYGMGGAALQIRLDAPEEALAAIAQIADEQPGAVLMFDSISTWADRMEWQRFRAFWPSMVDVCKRFRLTICLFTDWPYGDGAQVALPGVDATIHLRAGHGRIMRNQFLSLDSTSWAPQARFAPRMFQARKPGGVVLYIPKIVVAGLPGAGKSTFVHAVSEEALSVERMGTTVTMDRGKAKLEGLEVEIFGMPGHERFGPVQKTLYRQTLGVVVVVDSTDGEGWAKSATIAREAWDQGIAVVVAANKQDAPGAASASEVKEALALPDAIEVIAGRATDPESARRVLETMVGRILTGDAR